MKNNDGTISSCANSGCDKTLGFRRCCDFQQGNYIVLHPGELAEAARQGLPVAHLRIVDADYHGGQKAVCAAHNSATCDGGLKPFDCKAYPLFPAGSENGDFFIKGSKCPLQPVHLAAHADAIRAMWQAIVSRNPEAAAWLDRVEMVGYTAAIPLRAAALMEAAA